MEKPKYRSALIVGTGPGLSASLARLLTSNGLAVSLAARQTDKLVALAKETGADVHACNAADPKDVAGLFDALDAKGRTPDVVVYNASARVRGALVDRPTTSSGRSRSARSAASWSPSRRRSACCPSRTAPSS
jgi:short-subunit dehydrogenase